MFDLYYMFSNTPKTTALESRLQHNDANEVRRQLPMNHGWKARGRPPRMHELSYRYIGLDHFTGWLMVMTMQKACVSRRLVFDYISRDRSGTSWSALEIPSPRWKGTEWCKHVAHMKLGLALQSTQPLIKTSMLNLFGLLEQQPRTWR